ncbi:hypothetical protein G647_09675 [Cladophialophora carrionii CBS 160.54]|uniref:Uncharacterized protein n=1 Tax=Cladophialophora carrionii CBS 160.54 TaxID=1279043 RepID=V9DKR2_9EURO|nr:uncharacterized protein G647_09675 [Cladophialophora carrionii CBS 160.54]ETI27484.1 hypothetical protein G647_09675 [Cladophialophora carrionii CBS 160.54]
MSGKRLLLLTLARARKLREYLPSALALALALPAPAEPRVVDMSCWRIGGPRGFRTGLGDCDGDDGCGSDDDRDDDAEHSVDRGWIMVSEEEEEDDEVVVGPADHGWGWVFVGNGYVGVDAVTTSAGFALCLPRDGHDGDDRCDDDDDDGDGGHAIDELSEKKEVYAGRESSESDSGESRFQSQFQGTPTPHRSEM